MQMYLISGFLILLLISGAVFYYNDTQNRIDELNKSNSILTSTVETQEKTLNEIKANAEIQKQLNVQLSTALNNSEKASDELRQKLSRHNLTGLVIAKPNLIERRMNDGTKEIFNKLRSITAVD